jgi:sugar lactone lactonase YvrE
MLLFVVVWALCEHSFGASPADPPGTRRVLYNLDGDSCLTTRAGSTGPVAITEADLKRLVDEITCDGSQVDTLLLCINAQVMYYPTKVGTLRGTLSTPEERSQWPPSERQRFDTVQKFFDAGVDPYAVVLAEMQRRGGESLLSFRVNDDHGNDFLRTQFRVDHPDYQLGTGALDFGKEAVREYVFRLIEEAVHRYDCDGLELDFNRFPHFFRDGSTDEQIAKMNSLVERVRQLLDELGQSRGRRLVLAVRVPSNFGRELPTPLTASELGCDVVDWARRGWVDFVTVSEFLHERYNLPLAEWKNAMTQVPIYGGIECSEGGTAAQYLTAAKYRRAARRLWSQGASGIYLFNFFTTREYGAEAWEPPFEVLAQLGSLETLKAVESGRDLLFVATPLTAPGSFTKGIEGPACDVEGNVYAVNFAREQTIGRVTPEGRASLFVSLPGESTGNGIRFGPQGQMVVADYVGHNVLRVDLKTRITEVLAHDPKMNQPNDLAIAPDGTLYASDPNWKTGTGQLWRIEASGQTKCLAAELGTTNGIEVSPDGRTLFVNESVQRNVWAYDLTADGRLDNKRLVHRFADFGLDGMRCDVDGNLYITRNGKGTVVKMSPTGQVLREINVLGRHPTNICFGGCDGCTAYVTEAEHQRLVQFRVDRPGLEWTGRKQANFNRTGACWLLAPMAASDAVGAGCQDFRGLPPNSESAQPTD